MRLVFLALLLCGACCKRVEMRVLEGVPATTWAEAPAPIVSSVHISRGGDCGGSIELAFANAPDGDVGVKLDGTCPVACAPKEVVRLSQGTAFIWIEDPISVEIPFSCRVRVSYASAKGVGPSTTLTLADHGNFVGRVILSWRLPVVATLLIAAFLWIHHMWARRGSDARGRPSG